jgi:cell division protein FtsQ
MSTSVKPRDDMDARIRARRARVRAEAVKRRHRRTLSLFFVLVIVGGVAVALRSPLFAISAIEVRGVGAERARVVRQAAAIHEGQHLLTAPLAEAQASVERLAWVKTATVHRLPPSTVAVDVTPRIPLLTVRIADTAWKVDEDAVVVDGGRVAGAPVIAVDGPDHPKLGTAIRNRTVRDAVRVHVALPAWLRDQVVAYRVAAPRDLWLRLRVPAAGRRGADGKAERERESGGQRAGSNATTVDVRFGTATDLALKAEVIRVLLPQAVEQERHLDVRAPTNPVVVESRAAASGSG